MNKTPPPQSKSDDKKDATHDTVGQAYESSLEKALSQAETGIHQLLNNDVDDSSADETIKLKRSIKRDLIDAAHHLNETGKELKDWLGFDIALIKNELWQKFTDATDKTTLELLKLKQAAAHAEYHTGEIIGLGTLVCDQCKASLHFHKPGHIPPCAKCSGTHFHRLNYEGY